MPNCQFNLQPQRLQKLLDALDVLERHTEHLLSPETMSQEVRGQNPFTPLKKRVADIMNCTNMQSQTRTHVYKLLYAFLREFYSVSLIIGEKQQSIQEFMRQQGLDIIVDPQPLLLQPELVPEINAITSAILMVPAACVASFPQHPIKLLSLYKEKLETAIDAYKQKDGDMLSSFYTRGRLKESFLDFLLDESHQLDDTDFKTHCRIAAVFLLIRGCPVLPDTLLLRVNTFLKNPEIINSLKQHIQEVKKYNQSFSNEISRLLIASLSRKTNQQTTTDPQLEDIETIGSSANQIIRKLAGEVEYCEKLIQQLELFCDSPARYFSENTIENMPGGRSAPDQTVLKIPQHLWEEIASDILTTYQSFLDLRIPPLTIVSLTSEAPEGIAISQILQWSNELCHINANGQKEWQRDTFLNGERILRPSKNYTTDEIKATLSRAIFRDPSNLTPQEETIIKYLATKAAGQDNMRVIDAILEGFLLTFDDHAYDSSSRQFGRYDWIVQQDTETEKKMVILKLSSTVTAYNEKQAGSNKPTGEIVYVGSNGQLLLQNPMDADESEYNDQVQRNAMQLPPIFTVKAEIHLKFENETVHPVLRQCSIISYREGMKLRHIDPELKINFAALGAEISEQAVVFRRPRAPTMDSITVQQRALWQLKPVKKQIKTLLPKGQKSLFTNRVGKTIRQQHLDIWSDAMQRDRRSDGQREWVGGIEWEGQRLLPPQRSYTVHSIQAALHEKILTALKELQPFAKNLDKETQAGLDYLRTMACGVNSNSPVVQNIFRDFTLHIGEKRFEAMGNTEHSINWFLTKNAHKLTFNMDFTSDVKLAMTADGLFVGLKKEDGKEFLFTANPANPAEMGNVSQQGQNLPVLFTINVHVVLTYDSHRNMMQPRVQQFSITPNVDNMHIFGNKSLLVTHNSKPHHRTPPPTTTSVASKIARFNAPSHSARHERPLEPRPVASGGTRGQQGFSSARKKWEQHGLISSRKPSEKGVPPSTNYSRPK